MTALKDPRTDGSLPSGPARRPASPLRQRSTSVGIAVLGIVLVLGFVLVAHQGNGRGADGSATSSATSTSAPSAAHGSVVPAASDGLSGFGATSAGWSDAHQPDPAVEAGVAYLPFVENADGGQAKYAAVQRKDGRVVGYILTLPAGTTARAARQAVLADFPSDAHIVQSFNATGVETDSQGSQSRCILLNVQSSRLATVLAPAPFNDPQGVVAVELYTTESDGLPGLHLANINAADVGLDGLGPAPISATSRC